MPRIPGLSELLGILQTQTEALAQLPRTLSERAATEKLFAQIGEVAARLRETDWARTPFGPVGQWPGSLRTMIRTVLDSPLAM